MKRTSGSRWSSCSHGCSATCDRLLPSSSPIQRSPSIAFYRDTRFSDDKTPLKTHVAAHFPSRAFGRSGGAGLYVEVTPQWVWIGGGLYMPSASDLQAIREHIAATHPRLH